MTRSETRRTRDVSELIARRILIVDDEPVNVRLLERILHEAGWTDICSTTDARAAAARHAEFRPDLVLLDLMMPFLDGVAVTRTYDEVLTAGAVHASVRPRA